MRDQLSRLKEIFRKNQSSTYLYLRFLVKTQISLMQLAMMQQSYSEAFRLMKEKNLFKHFDLQGTIGHGVLHDL
jgi:hypothetical protein